MSELRTDQPGAAALGAALRRLVGERAVLTCLGASAWPAVPAAAAARPMPAPCPPAALPIWLLVGGRAVDAAAAARALGPAATGLAACGLVVADGGEVRATAAVAALGAGVVVCDRLDAPATPDLVPWPDDSSLHLLGALPPGRLGAWLDVGTGAAIAPLAAGPRAARVRATDVNPRALARAAAGAALSGRADLELAAADLLAGAGPGWDLITFNAPIPGGDPRLPVWRHGAADVLARFWAAAGDHVAPGGEVLVHARIDDDPWPVHAGRPGAVVIARYTTPGQPGFAVTRWVPGAPPARVVIDVALGRDRPFVTRADLALPP